MKITKRQLRRIIREATEKTYLGVPEEHILNALHNTWSVVRVDVPGSGRMKWDEIGEEVMAMMPAYESEMADIFNKLSFDEQNKLLKKAFR